MQPTSLQAYHSVQGETIARHYKIIEEVLRKIGRGNAYEVSLHCHLRKEQCGRRLGEMARLNIVEDAGTTAPTDSNRQAVQYKIKSNQSHDIQ